MENKVVTSSRIREIDGLRGIAILMVISFHYINNQLLFSINPVERFLCKVTSFGWMGVDLFFVISGFLIGSILIRYKGSKNYFTAFYVKRLIRILPNYFLFLFAFTIIGVISAFKDNYMLRGNMVIPLWSYFILIHNFFMAAYHNMGNGSLSVTWSIGVEEQFYIVFPFILYFMKKQYLPYFLLLVVISAITIRMQYDHWIPAYVLLTSRMDVIAVGIMIAYLNEEGYLIDFGFKRQLGVIFVMLIDVFLCGILYYKFGDLGVYKHTLFALFFGGCLVLALTKMPYYSFILRNKFLVWVGVISYSLYLFHYLILALVHHFVGNKAGVVIDDKGDWWVTLFSLLISFSVAWVIYKGIEAPIVRIGREKISY